MKLIYNKETKSFSKVTKSFDAWGHNDNESYEFFNIVALLNEQPGDSPYYIVNTEEGVKAKNKTEAVEKYKKEWEKSGKYEVYKCKAFKDVPGNDEFKKAIAEFKKEKDFLN